MDDCLSSVDAHVGRHIFDSVISESGLLKDKARVFVTHGIQYLEKTSGIIMLQDGKIVEEGVFNELMVKKGLLYTLMTEHSKKSQGVENGDVSTTGSNTEFTVTKNETEQKPLIVKETIVAGKVEWDVYKSYAKSVGYWISFFVVLLASEAQMFAVGQNIILSYWADANDKSDNTVSPFKWLLLYSETGMLFAVFTVGVVLLGWVYGGINAARILHSEMLDNVLKLPQSFFDTTPMGRIINRFSKDIYVLDDQLPRSFLMYFRTLFTLSAIYIVNLMVSSWFSVIAVPLMWIYGSIQKYYLATSRQLKRLESTSRSPVYAHFQESLNGVSTIRAFKQQARFTEGSEVKVDQNTKAYYCSMSSNRWLAIRLSLIGSLLVFSSCIFGIVSLYLQVHISSSVIGLMLVYSLTVTQTLNWMVRQSSEIETNIVCVERIKEYIDIPQEAPYILDSDPVDWPTTGEIDFVKYSTRYRDGLDTVLDGIDLFIKGNEKIGCVGRTGAGLFYFFV